MQDDVQPRPLDRPTDAAREGAPPPQAPAPSAGPWALESAPIEAPPAVSPPSFAPPAVAPAPMWPAPSMHHAPSPAGASPSHFPAPLAPRSLLIVVTIVSLVADLATKAWVTTHLAGLDLKVRGSKHLDVVKDHFELIFAQNPGGAWSFLRGWPDTIRRPFFLVVSAAAVVFIISIYGRVHRDQWAMKWGLPLALGGAIGNLVDRIHYGWVVDFLDVYVARGGREHHWPTFNVADIAIVIGVGLMAIDMLWLARRREKAAERRAAPPPSPPQMAGPFMAPPA